MSNSFPDGFLWGAATAAYQVEGAAELDGRGPSHWDEFLHTPGTSPSGDTGDVACEHYRRFADDVELMKSLGLRAYRFSVSWPRVMPRGRGGVNAKGLDFYDRLVDALLRANIQPMTTAFHWDLPLALQKELGGWASDDLPEIFADYAELLFNRLGDRVKLWMTLNEPWVVVDGGYFHGVHPPGLRDRAAGFRAGHNLMRAHAYAVERYRASKHRDGKISFALNSSWSFPASDAPHDVEAADRAVQNFAGWFGDPAWLGDYPAVMRERWGDLLPHFTSRDAKLLTKSIDYLALNYYTSEVVRHAGGEGPMEFEVVPQPNVPHTQMNWPIRADGFERLMVWLSRRYGELPMYITENGAAMDDKPEEGDFVDDGDRIRYLRDHLQACLRAMDQGVNLKGYMVWSLMDNLEWSMGFSKRFGIVRCDHKTQKRTVKASGKWYARLIREGVGL